MIRSIINYLRRPKPQTKYRLIRMKYLYFLQYYNPTTEAWLDVPVIPRNPENIKDGGRAYNTLSIIHGTPKQLKRFVKNFRRRNPVIEPYLMKYARDRATAINTYNDLHPFILMQ